jgi:methyl-accepting chemotaxis protein
MTMPPTATTTRARPAPKNGAKAPAKGKNGSSKNGSAAKASKPAPLTTRERAEAHVAQFKAEALDAVSTAVMMIDRDLILYDMNQAAYKLMKKAEPAFRDVWPGFDPDNLIGQCIDKFHVDPSHQRRLLDDPANLPYQADIEVAGLSFGLGVTAQIDPDGEFVGCTLEWEDLTEFLEVSAKVDAMDRSQATIEFTLEGTILSANENFLATLGYTADEIRGQHHRMFVDPVEVADPAYQMFWDRLARGEVIGGEFKRVDKAGEDVWIQATYNPVLDRQGKPVKVFKMATDITAEKSLQLKVEEIVDRASSVMGAVAEGDLTDSIDGEYEEGLAQLQEATNTSIENLASLVSQIRTSAGSMSTSAGEVATANQDLSRRTEAQAASLEETASSMEQMTATVEQNAENARQASQLAVGAREQAQSGGQVVEKAVEAVRAISESSKKIADIIGVIDEIAFQTNILALNAAVEAARAGDQGRGFAVVASEVGNLAQRSAGAAKEIKSLIQDSLEKVEDGSDLVNQSGSQLSEIVDSVKKVSDIIGEIAAASVEQSAGVNQVNQAVAEMDQGTQQNAAMVGQAAAASESVQQQSHALLQLTGQFRIPGEAVSAGQPVAPVPAAAPVPVAPVPGQLGAPAGAAPWSDDGAPGGDEAWQEF